MRSEELLLSTSTGTCSTSLTLSTFPSFHLSTFLASSTCDGEILFSVSIFVNEDFKPASSSTCGTEVKSCEVTASSLSNAVRIFSRKEFFSRTIFSYSVTMILSLCAASSKSLFDSSCACSRMF